MTANARVRSFLDALEPGARATAERSAGFAAALDRVVEAARAAWPDIALDDATFLAHLAERAGEPTADSLVRLPAADLYLACACARGIPVALRAFDDQFVGAIDPALRHAGLFPDLFDEVKQRLRIKLFTSADGHAPRILDYLGRGNLRGWLRIVAVREALNTLRGDKRALAGGLSEVPLVTDDPVLDHLKTRYRGEFRDAIAEAAGTLEPRERNLLRQYYLDGLTYDVLARMYRVHLATVARWVDKAREALLASTRRVLVTRMNIPRDELDSILRLIESQLEVSARDLLGELDA
jgi:RNA polymerase sigma-70 factor (ECF subfamily)